jgi:hypothetical protein
MYDIGTDAESPKFCSKIHRVITLSGGLIVIHPGISCCLINPLMSLHLLLYLAGWGAAFIYIFSSTSLYSPY